MNTHNIPFSIKMKIILNYPKFAAIGFFFKGLKNEFEIAMVNEPLVLKPLKFYCSKRGSIAHSFTLSPSRRPDMTEILLKMA